MPVQGNLTKEFKAARNYKIIRQFYDKKAVDLERDLKISKQNLSTWENEKGDPGPEFVDQLSDYFGLRREVFYMDGLTEEYLKTMKNNTGDQKRSDNTEKPLGDPEVYRVIVEGKTEYVLVPREVMKDSKLIAKDQFTETIEMMKTDREMMKSDRRIMELLMNKFLDTAEKLMQPQPMQPQKGKQGV